jgi:hypothetical protein
MMDEVGIEPTTSCKHGKYAKQARYHCAIRPYKYIGHGFISAFKILGTITFFCDAVWLSTTTMATSKLSKTSSKPASQTKSSISTLGAPAQHNQSSRKGKRAWRKNVNIEDVEEGLEGMRAEERVIG